jgi:penicillin-binding protein 1C
LALNPEETGKQGERSARLRGLLAAGILGLCLLLAVPVLLALDRRYPPPLDRVETSVVVSDRDGALLRPFAISDGRWRLRVGADEVDPAFLRMVVAYEDRRFYSHFGVDPPALARAFGQFVGHGRIVSGASTLTMQLARLIEPMPRNALAAKAWQMVRALQIERRLSKHEILSLYLTLAPYGGNLEGVRAASLAWFGKEPRRLSLTQAAMLVALPQAPESRRPDRAPEAALAARNHVLARMAKAGVIAMSEAQNASKSPLRARRRELPVFAAHAAQRARESVGKTQGEVRLTIDGRIQRELERLAGERARTLGAGLSVAILAMDQTSGEILAHIGSTGFFDRADGSQIDLADVPRSPGSALKPFIYALAFETGLVRPATLIEDRPADFSGYRPSNFDQDYRGTVTVAEALQLSLNVPAVRLLDAVGPPRLVARLRRAHVTPRLPRGEPPGLAVALGGVGVTLKELVALYGALARGGEAVFLHEIAGPPVEKESIRLFDEAASWYVSEILSGVAAPRPGARSVLAYKTGTSYGYRDGWAIGFDGAHTVGVWVGRADGSAVPGLTGRSHAAPILFDAFARLALRRTPLPSAPEGARILATADLPAPLRRFSPPGEVFTGPLHGAGPHIAFPPDGAHVELGLDDGKAAPLALKVQGGQPPFRWLADGRPIDAPVRGRRYFWQAGGRGFSTLTVIDAQGRSSAVRVYLE